MPLMAAYDQNDAREAARLLARCTLDGLRHPDGDTIEGNAINNMYRLLLGYGSHGFYGYVEHARPEDEGSLTSLLTSSDRNVGDLRQALDETFDTVFAGKDAASAISDMKPVLRMAAYQEGDEKPNPEAVRQTEKFFEVFLERLKD